MIKYVCGFMFSEDLKRVVLIKKIAKPGLEHFKDSYNGVGGKVQNGESSFDAMSREFEEETGVKTDPADWWYYSAEDGDGWLVRFFFCKGNVDACRTVEEEEISVHRVSDIYSLPVIPNLLDLIPRAVLLLLTQS